MRRLLVAAAAVGALALPAQASAAPCWKHLLVDAYDFRIDGTYSAGCYVQAMRHMSPDLRDYSDLWDVLNRALATVTARPHRTVRSVAAVQVPPTAKLPPAARPRRPAGAFVVLVDRTDRGGSPTSVPLPLLVLGGVGSRLAAAGAAGALLRRRRSRGS